MIWVSFPKLVSSAAYYEVQQRPPQKKFYFFIGYLSAFPLKDIDSKEQCIKCLLTSEMEYPGSLTGFLPFVDLKSNTPDNI